MTEPANHDGSHNAPDHRTAPPRESLEAGLVEVGWLVCDNLDEVDQQAIEAARIAAVESLRHWLPGYRWTLSSETREPPGAADQREPTEYLQWARTQRDVRGWDFVFIFVRPDITARQRPYAWACVSRSFDSAIVSTARIDPRADDPEAPAEERADKLARRVKTLALRALGHLLGAPRVHEADDNLMGDFADIGDLDRAREFTERQLGEMGESLARIADLRLEEELPPARAPAWSFYPRAAWRNRAEILEGLRQARAWQMPFRLARLTFAALTTMLVLMMTAEAWELGTRQSPPGVAGLSLAAMVATVAYVLNRQKLLLGRRREGLSEQIVTTNVATVAIVATGILVTYACLFSLTLLITLLLFDGGLVASWTPSLEGKLSVAHYAVFSAFVSSAGIVIGALGASFEGQHYFRHITFVDEEV